MVISIFSGRFSLPILIVSREGEERKEKIIEGGAGGNQKD